jgi:hypothetical protein
MVYYPCSVLPHHFPSRSQLSPCLNYLHIILAISALAISGHASQLSCSTVFV